MLTLGLSAINAVCRVVVAFHPEFSHELIPIRRRADRPITHDNLYSPGMSHGVDSPRHDRRPPALHRKPAAAFKVDLGFESPFIDRVVDRLADCHRHFYSVADQRKIARHSG